MFILCGRCLNGKGQLGHHTRAISQIKAHKNIKDRLCASGILKILTGQEYEKYLGIIKKISLQIIQNKYNYVTCKQTLWGALGKGEKRGDSRPRPPPPSPSQRVCLQANNCGKAGICEEAGQDSIVIQIIAVLECRNCCLLKLGGNYQRLSNCHILRTSPPCSRNL